VSVWAPRASTVDLVLPEDGEREAMLAQDGGWWRSRRTLETGTDYAFSLDGGEPRPDPRSPWQPHGVHGPSRLCDPDVYQWGDDEWPGRSVLGAVIYELHVGTFTPEGTLDAAVDRLDHLAALGVDIVELMPVAAFPGARGWGYDGVGLYAVHEPYGGPAALQRFVDAAHGRGLGVCLDVVYNHLGPDGNYLAEFGPYFTDRHETPWGAAINLDGDERERGTSGGRGAGESDADGDERERGTSGGRGAGESDADGDEREVRRFLIDNAVRWLRDFHIDALRLDAVHALVDDSPRHLLAELSDTVAALEAEVGRPLSLIAESDLNDPAMVTPTAAGGRGMTAQWADDVHHALHALLTGERHGYYVDFGDLDTAAKAFTDVFVHDGSYSTFRGRPWGAPVPPETDRRRFVVFAQNHDQVGNRALGDRPSRVLSPGLLAVSAAAVLLGTGTPMLFMGEEWGATTPFLYFTDHTDELGRLVREGRREEFGTHGWAELYGQEDLEVPDPQALETFEASRLDWAEANRPPHEELLRFTQDLIRLRRAEPDLTGGDVPQVRTGEDCLTIRRGRITIVLALRACEVPVGGDLLLGWDATASERATRLSDAGVAVLRTSAQP